MRFLLIVILGLTLAGCSSTKKTSNASTPETPSVVSGIDGVYSGGDGYDPGKSYATDPATDGDFYDDPEYGVNVIGGPSSPAKDRVIYFSFDSSDTADTRALNIIRAHADYLNAHPGTRILLEGHTDSRGSRGYNIALGERRAISVLKEFNKLGVPAQQIRVISYGEERPAAQGFSEDSYKRNRRVIIQY